jgi:hypothetical protein
MSRLSIELIDDLEIGLSIIETLAFATSAVALMPIPKKVLMGHVYCLQVLIEEQAISLRELLRDESRGGAA